MGYSLDAPTVTDTHESDTQFFQQLQTIGDVINQLKGDQEGLIDLFDSLDPDIQKQFGVLFLYLQINRTISSDDFFQLARKFNLPKLPKELTHVLRFGVSDTGHMNPDYPANLDYTPEWPLDKEP